jgi:CRISPR-associated endonuclease/helicase Cas3
MSLTIDLAPIAYDQSEAPWLPNRQPYPYQQQVYQLVCETLAQRKTLCLFLVTPTGSGKTLASYAHSILTGEPVLGVYPTNELIADQERALRAEFEASGTNRVLRVDSSELDRWQINFDLKRHSETLETLMHWRPVLLTNPDILFYIFFGLYQGLPGIAQRLFRLVGDVFSTFVFDEFHLYNIKQVADVAFLIGTLQRINPTRGRIFIFASATPSSPIISLLREKLGIRVEIIEAMPSEIPHARVIAHPLRLILIPTDLDRWQGTAAFTESIGIIDAFRQNYSQGRFVAIFDAVAGAIEVARYFRNRYPGIAVGEVHGFSSHTSREEATKQQVTVGTSTIEVGVDFKAEREKDFLIFEARTAGQFIQRLGRIARHDKSLPIPHYALALAPAYVCNFLTGVLAEKPSITRKELYSLIEEAYVQPEDLQSYLRRHAPAELYAAIRFIRPMFQPDDQPRVSQSLEEILSSITDSTVSQAAGKHRSYEERGILAPLLTFRGAEFEAALLDRRGEDPGFPAKRYNLFFLLRRGAFEEMGEEDFINEIEALGRKHPEWSEEVARERRFAKLIERGEEKLLGVYGHFHLKGLLPEARRVWFEVGQDEIWGKKGDITVISGLSLATDLPAPLRQLNRFFQKKRLVSWFTDSPPSTIRFGRALPALFSVYELRVILPGGKASNSRWSIAFNQTAFFLSSLYWRKSGLNEAFII